MKPLKYVHIVQEHVINAPREKVFKALTQEVGDWWSHYVEEGSKITQDAKIGGSFQESFKAG